MTITPETPFTFPLIDHALDEARYLRAQDLMSHAARLVGNGEGGDLGENPEYERGQAELICDVCSIPIEFKGQVIEQIHDIATDVDGQR